MAVAEQLHELEELSRPATLSACLAQPMLCDCGREYRRGDFWARREPIVCECGERISYRCPWVHCEHHIALNRSWGQSKLAQPPPCSEVALVGVFCRLEMVDGERSYTLEEVGHQDNCTRERVRQLEAKALQKLGRALQQRGETAEDVRAYLAEVTSGRAAADKTVFAPASGGALHRSSRGIPITDVRSSARHGEVRHPDKPAYSPRRGPEALPLPPSLAPHRESLGRRSRARGRRWRALESKPSTVEEASPPTASIFSTSIEEPKQEEVTSERPEQRPSRDSAHERHEAGQRGEIPPGTEDSQERAQDLIGGLHRRRDRRAEGLPIPDSQHRSQEPEAGPGEALGAPREEVGLMTIERITELLAIDAKLQELQAQRDAIAAEVRESPDLPRLLEVLGVRVEPPEAREPEARRRPDAPIRSKASGLVPGSFGDVVLAHLRGGPPSGVPKDIADATGVPRKRMGATLSKLRDKGLVRRVRPGEWEAV